MRWSYGARAAAARPRLRGNWGFAPTCCIPGAAKRGPRGPARSPEELARENAVLREEVERLREQRDILKKSLGILTEPPLRGLPKSKL